MGNENRLSLKDLTNLFHGKKDFKKINLEGGSFGTEIELRHLASGSFSPHFDHLGVAFRASNGEYNQVTDIKPYASGPQICRHEATASYFQERLRVHSPTGAIDVKILPEELEKAEYWGDRNRITVPLSQNGLGEFILYISAE